jgi:hypothetical protein
MLKRQGGGFYFVYYAPAVLFNYNTVGSALNYNVDISDLSGLAEGDLSSVVLTGGFLYPPVSSRPFQHGV